MAYLGLSKLPVNVDDLLHQRQVEGARIEYKAGWNPDPILRTLCAFANDFENLGGGYIVVGLECDQDGQPIYPPQGIPANQLDRIQRELLSFCKLMEPAYFPLLSLEPVDGRNLLILWAPGGENRPYKVPRAVTAKAKEYHYYIRRYANTVEARGQDEIELISLAAKVPFDDRFHLSATLDDLSGPLIGEFLLSVKSALAQQTSKLSIESVGRHMNIVGGLPEAPRPKNVGILFFNAHPEKFFPATQIDVVWFPEGAGGDRFEEKTFQGPLDRILRNALHFVQSNYLREIVVKRPDRAEAERFWNFPFAAVEEALVNAVYHRSYEIREPIEVRISPEELTILSFPGPDRSIKLADLRTGKAISRRYRNRRLGEFLKELRLTEGRSTGISKILRSMKVNNSPPPEFETDEDRTYFLARLPAHRLTPQDTHQDAPQDTPQVSPLVGHLLKICQGDLSRDELQSQLGLADRNNFRVAYLAPALELGLVEMTLPQKPTSRHQRYRLTPSGQAWLAAHSHQQTSREPKS